MRTIAIACIAGAIGLAIGAASTLWYLSGPMQQSALAKSQVDAAQNISVLEELRAGKIETARQLLEGYVDAAVIGLDHTARENPALARAALSTLAVIAKYRSTINYTPSPLAREAGVPQILEAARKGRLTDRSKSNAPNAARR